MGKSRWNRMVSIPVKSLTQEELKEAIHEWAEGCDELEKLLWTCYEKGLETAGSHVGKHNNYLDFYVASNSKSQLKKVLFVAEAYGFSESFMMFGGNPISGPEWYRTHVDVSCLIPENVAEFYANITQALENENTEIPARCFGMMIDFAEFFEGKMAMLNFRMKVRNHSEYEFFIETFANQQNWAYFDELFSSCGMIQKTRDDAPFICWYLKSSSKEDFYDTLQNLLDKIRENWNFNTPTEVTDDMNFDLKALIMQKKFGTTPEGVKKMNAWINSNHPRLNGRKVNY